MSKQIYASEDYVNEALQDKITAPSAASVGQTIVVKSVDDAGKPTEWEAVDSPTKLSDLENDLYYADKASRTLSITLADCTTNEYGASTCDVYFPEGADPHNVRFELIGKWNGITFRYDADNYPGLPDIDRETGNWYVYLEGYCDGEVEMEAPLFLLCHNDYDAESKYLRFDGGIMNDDTGEYVQLEELLFRFVKLESKKISKDVLDIPKEVTDVFVVAWDWSTDGWSADVATIHNAYQDGKRVVLYDADVRAEHTLYYSDENQAVFTRLDYNAPTRKFIPRAIVLYWDGTTESASASLTAE